MTFIVKITPFIVFPVLSVENRCTVQKGFTSLKQQMRRETKNIKKSNQDGYFYKTPKLSFSFRFLGEKVLTGNAAIFIMLDLFRISISDPGPFQRVRFFKLIPAFCKP